jgi:hypothetical protein
MKPRSAGSQMAQLRDDIDKGKTGDKVAWPDPAAAPLGTDDEAAGALPPAYVVEDMRRNERQKRPDAGDLKLRHSFLVASVVGAVMIATLVLLD